MDADKQVKGKKVAVLERGREFLPGDFPEGMAAAAAETGG